MSKEAISSFDLTIHASTGKAHIPLLRKSLTAAHQYLRPPLSELSIALVGDSKMSALHLQFMNVSGPTDVLTFPLDFDEKGREIAGEVVVCVPEAARQARTRGIRVEHELVLYAVHGMLHLCGFDDRTEAAFRQMHRKENDILIRLGFGPVFGKVEPDDAVRKSWAKPATALSRSSVKRTGENRRRRSLARNERVGD